MLTAATFSLQKKYKLSAGIKNKKIGLPKKIKRGQE
jgi:hypothetical protein